MQRVQDLSALLNTKLSFIIAKEAARLEFAQARFNVALFRLCDHMRYNDIQEPQHPPCWCTTQTR